MQKPAKKRTQGVYITAKQLSKLSEKAIYSATLINGEWVQVTKITKVQNERIH